MSAPDPDLRRKTASGVLWAGAQTLSTKIASMAGQVILARFLLQPREFGLVGLALTVTTFTSLFQQVGLRDVLVRRQRRFARWSNVAFWMSLPMTIGAGALTLALAPVAARVFHQPTLVPLLGVSALVVIVNGLSIVPSARLQTEFRFRLLGCLGIWEAVGLNLATILLAWAGLGAFSVVLGQLAVAVVRSIVLWHVARPIVKFRAEAWRWRYLIGASATTLGAGAAIALVGQGDYIALGLFHDARAVGTYFFAFNLSIHVHIVLSAAFVGVLLTSLSNLRTDPGRQLRAFVSACRLIAAVGMPLCLFQAAFAPQVIHVMFGRGKWEGAIPLLQILSVGMAFRLATGPAHSMIKAQGRFRQFLAFAAAYCAGFVLLVVTASRWGGPAAVAGVAASCMALVEPALIGLCVRNAGGAVRTELGSIYAAPLVSGVFAVAVAWTVAGLARPHLRVEVIDLAIAAVVMAGSYAAALRVTSPALWREWSDRAARLLARAGTAANDEKVPQRSPSPEPIRVIARAA